MRFALAPLAVLLLLGLTSPSRAMWINTTQEVPVERLVENLTKRVAAHPDDAQAHYVLGRIHSMAWARGTPTVPVVPADEEGGLPGFAPFQTVRESPGADRRDAPLSDGAVDHFHRAVAHYQRAAALDPSVALAFLGQAYMLDHGTPWAAQIGRPDGAEVKSAVPEEERERYRTSLQAAAAAGSGERPDLEATLLAELMDALPRSVGAVLGALEVSEAGTPLHEAARKVLVRWWEDQALAAYRKVFEMRSAADLAETAHPMEGEGIVSLEAAQAIVRILEARGVDDDEVRRMRAAAAKLEALPRWVTPIVFPLDGVRPLADLLPSGRVATFDLDGDGRAGRWPWVSANTGILVWAPDPSMPIVSGRQLFGSVTWWMFFRDGYEALAALDDDGNGWLEREELEGIAVWHDRDGDAVSDPGEVVPVRGHGIAAVAVRAAGRHDGIPAHAAGIRLIDGRTRPTYDWTPERASVPPSASQAPAVGSGSGAAFHQ